MDKYTRRSIKTTYKIICWVIIPIVFVVLIRDQKFLTALFLTVVWGILFIPSVMIGAYHYHLEMSRIRGPLLERMRELRLENNGPRCEIGNKERDLSPKEMETLLAKNE